MGKSILKQLIETGDSIKKMNRRELYHFGKSNGWHTGASFARYKLALEKIGVDYKNTPLDEI